MKKLFAILLIFITIFSLCACNPDKTGIIKNVDAKSLLNDAFIDPVNEWHIYDNLIAQIKAETNYQKRTELIHKAEDILMANGCVIPLYYANDIYLQKEYVENVYCNVFSYKYFQNVNMKNNSKTIRVNLAGEPDSLDPAFITSNDGGSLIVNSFAGLYTYDKNGKTVPDLASGYTVSKPDKDGCVTFTFTLKENLKCSDGSILDANDFVYSWKRASNEKTGSDYGYMFSQFVGYPNDLNVSAPDKNTLVFTLKEPCAYIESLMATPTFFPVKRFSVESYVNWQTEPTKWCNDAGFISNGPFICTGWTHGKSMVFEKNPYYHNASMVTINKIEFTLSSDATDIYGYYKNSKLDFIDNVPADAIKKLKNSSELKIIDNPGTHFISFNAKSDLFTEKTAEESACMRLALNILIDREYIAEAVGQTYQVAANSFIPLGMNDGNGGIFKSTAESNAYYSLNVNNDTIEKARTFLKAAGFIFDKNGKLSSKTPIVIEYLTINNTNYVMEAQAIKADFEELGVQMTIKKVDWNTYIQTRKEGNFDIIREGLFADFDDPVNMLEFFTTDSENNYCNFGSKK